MMNKKTKLLLSITLLLVLVLPMLSFADQNTQEAYDLGEKWGDTTGRVYGFRDMIKGEASNWYNAYREVYEDEDYIVDFYDLDAKEELYTNRFITGLRTGFMKGYIVAYENVISDPEGAEGTSESSGVEHGKYFGELEGQKAGLSDYSNNKYNDWEDNMPSETAIRTKYNLYKDTEEYSDAFIETYEENFKIAYRESYRNANVESKSVYVSNGYDDGYMMGTAQGEADGAQDVIQGRLSNWLKAYNTFVEESNLMMRYNLYRDNKEYQDHFTTGFKIAYESAYQQSYQDVNITIEESNINYKKIDSFANTVTFNSYAVNMSNGNQNTISRQMLSLIFDEGTVYHSDTYIGISERQQPFRDLDGKKNVTPIYNINVINNDHSLNLQKNIKLNFNFTGDSTAGIYKYVNRQWMYLDTKYDQGQLYTEIPSGEFKGGQYAVLIDPYYKPLNYVSLHWAYDDIRVFIKRGFIDPYKNFNPDDTITRKEFSQLIYDNTHGLKNISYDQWKDFEDVALFGEYTNAINFMVKNGYMLGVSDSEFNPNGKITYYQVQIVMDRILESEFSWYDIEESMLKEKFHRSEANDYLSNAINKGEVVYMLNKVLGNQILFEQ